LVSDRRRPARHERLAEVVVGHPAATAGEHLADAIGDRLVMFEIDAHHHGDRLSGEVVMGRPEPAADDHGVGLVQQASQLGGDASDVVADLDLHERVDATGGELLAEPRRVGVDDLAEQQLGADRQHVAAHQAAWRAAATGRERRVACHK
jgi:hypothetical protein